MLNFKGFNVRIDMSKNYNVVLEDLQMVNSNIETRNGTKGTIGNTLGGISIGVALIMALFIVNFLTGFIDFKKLEGMPILIPIFLAPFSGACGFIGYYLNKGKLSLFGIIFNIIMFLVPFVYMILGTLIFGV